MPRKKKVNEPLPIETEKPVSNPASLRVLKNGAVYDMEKHRIVDSKGITTKITSENARQLQTLAIAKKREAVRAAAQDAVQRGDLVRAFGDAAWIAEITQAQMMLATSPEAGKASTIAADWLMRNGGVDEKQAEEAPKQEADSGRITALSELIRETRQLIEAAIPVQIRETINTVDGKVVE